jgi:hypothetical protein
MGRVVLLAALLYGYGHLGFDGRRALAMLDDARSMRYLATALRQLNDAL